MDVQYTQEYYQNHLTGAISSANVVLSTIASFYKPLSVVDFGCGSGAWLKVAKGIFHSRVLGVDQHLFSEINMQIEPDEYITHNLETPININCQFDLAISVEVAEHIAEEFDEIYIKTLCEHSCVILFSAALPMQGGTGHINERNCSYWADKFAHFGYFPIDCLRPRLWDNSSVEIWYRNNSILFVSKDKKAALESMIPPCQYPLDIVHPLMLKRIIERSRHG